MTRANTIVGYGIVLDDPETQAQHLAGVECQVLPNAPEGYSRIYIKENILAEYTPATKDGKYPLFNISWKIGASPECGSWRGPYTVKTKFIKLTR
jgi:hypothetical protein